jgi:alcohol dehydrogenase
MRALRYDDALHLVDDEPEPTLEPGEALIALRLAGICHTDLELTRGYLNFRGVLGHEFVGTLLSAAGQWRAGQRVVGEINIADGTCDYCAAGLPSQCRHRRTLGIRDYAGTFADRLRLPAVNLHGVPDNVSDEQAVFTEPLAAALQVTALTHIQPDQRVIVVGAGKLGLLCAQVLKLTGCLLRVVARQPRPLALLEKWRIPAIDARKRSDWMTVLRHQNDVVVDCTGNAEGFALALELVRPRGSIVLKSTYSGLPAVDLTRVVVDEVRLIGSRCGPFGAALQLMANQLVDVESLIERAYPLSEAQAAFEHAAERGVLKILLRS